MAKYNGPAALQSDTLSNRQPAKPQGKVTIPVTALVLPPTSFTLTLPSWLDDGWAVDS